MTYYECADCGQLGTFVGVERSPIARECPVCEAVTSWDLAFVDEDGGASP